MIHYRLYKDVCASAGQVWTVDPHIKFTDNIDEVDCPECLDNYNHAMQIDEVED